MFRILFSFLFFCMVIPSFAIANSCPDLAGDYICQPSIFHNAPFPMTVTQSNENGKSVYQYYYYYSTEVGSTLTSSDIGEQNYDPSGDPFVSRCANGRADYLHPVTRKPLGGERRMSNGDYSSYNYLADGSIDDVQICIRVTK